MDESPLLLQLDLPGRSRPSSVSIQFGAQGPRTWSGVEAELQICLDSRVVAFTSRVNLRQRECSIALHMMWATASSVLRQIIAEKPGSVLGGQSKLHMRLSLGL